MSCSEDGQLRSPGEQSITSAEEVEQETEALDIKPPQVYTTEYSKRKEKKHKEKRKRRDCEEDCYDDSVDEERERRSNAENKKYYKIMSTHLNVERYHHQRGYEREDLSSINRRYQKVSEVISDSHHGHHYHYQSQQLHYPSQRSSMHVPRQRDFYEREISQNSGIKNDYYDNRIVYQDQHGNSKESVRRKHKYELQKDADSLEQDLRSRLLRKRHKCVKDNNDREVVNELMRDKLERLPQSERLYDNKKERNERGHSSERERSRKQTKLLRHQKRLEKVEKANVIEVLDSLDDETEDENSKHNKVTSKQDVNVAEYKSHSLEDPDLLARKNKFLAAEREKEKRKEAAREELEARREKRRIRAELSSNALSPSSVAASVTAGLNIIKHKPKKLYQQNMKYLNPKHISNEENAKQIVSDSYEKDEIVNDDKQDESESSSGESLKYYQQRQNAKNLSSDENNDSDVELNHSFLSKEGTGKSPNHSKELKQRRMQKSKNLNHNDSFEDERLKNSENYSTSQSSADSLQSPNSQSTSNSPSQSRSQSPSSSRSYEHSKSDSSRHSYVHNRFNSRSSSYRKVSLSVSRSRSRSRSRSEERDMLPISRTRSPVSESGNILLQRKHKVDRNGSSPVLDDKGVPLPNYFPGVQGCRSVEEFQCLNRIEEGTYGVVYRAKDKRTNEIIALKRLKMEKEKDGFPITSLREINTLLKGQHPNIVTVREIVVGSNMDKIFIVMDYVEHDLKSLMETMKTRKQSFLPGEVKCLLQQLLRAVQHLHDNWILHRDLKTSNLLLSHKGILKVGDFGLAREYGSPLRKYTSLVVTLWYRSPELLLCTPLYSTPVDIWSVGCIFAEFLQMSPLFPGKSEVDSINKIFKLLGTPNEKIWPGYNELPAVKNMIHQNSQFAEYSISNLRKQFADRTCEWGISLLQGLLTYDPKQRLTAESALRHTYFKELPLPIDPSMFPTWPAKSELGTRKPVASSPKPPSGGSQFKQLGKDDIVASGSNKISGIITGSKKTATNSGFVLNAGLDQRQIAMAPGFTLKF